jgi:hypothetical protein
MPAAVVLADVGCPQSSQVWEPSCSSLRAPAKTSRSRARWGDPSPFNNKSPR